MSLLCVLGPVRARVTYFSSKCIVLWGPHCTRRLSTLNTPGRSTEKSPDPLYLRWFHWSVSILSNPTKSSTEHKDCVVQSAEVPCYGGQAVVWQWKSCDAVEKVVAATGLPQPPPPDVRWVRRPDRKHCFHNLLHVFFIQLVLYFIEYYDK